MSDEELLIKYRKYKKKRRIIILSIVLLFILTLSIILYFYSNNTSSSEIEKTKESEIKTKDEEAPEIVLKVESTEIMKGGDVNYLDYVESVIDKEDGDLFSQLKYEEIDTSVVGECSIIYTVSDKAGNTAQELLKVNIVEPIVEENIPEQKIEESIKSNQQKSGSSSKNIQQNKVEEKQKEQVQENVTENPKQEQKSDEKITKYFLFSDGYTMANVAEACASELRKINKTGMCSPIQDDKGIYLGMKLEIK